MLSQTKTFGPGVSLTQCQLVLNQALTFRLCTQLMDKVESSAQFEVARFSECKRIMHQPYTVRKREYGIRLCRFTRYSREASGSV